MNKDEPFINWFNDTWNLTVGDYKDSINLNDLSTTQAEIYYDITAQWIIVLHTK